MQPLQFQQAPTQTLQFGRLTSHGGNPSSTQYVTSGVYQNYNATFYQRVISYENSVEQVVGKVSLGLGTADAGIVFVSDAVYGNMTGSQVTFLPIDVSVNTKGTYGIGVVGSTTHTDLAQKFMDYWSSDAGKALLTQFGFNS